MKIFVTGATGFIGRRVLALLADPPTNEVWCLARTPAALPARDNIHAVRGALPDDLAATPAALDGCDVVVHLAAQTGKARPAQHRRMHVDGTDRLIQAAREAGVPRFIHVSTIAVTYPEKRHYPYARTKEEAERVVRGCGLDWAILRPTIVFGPASAVADGLAGLAQAPVLPLFGGGEARLQPVHVDDVALAIAGLVTGGALGGRTIDFGGRDVVTFADFLRRLRVALKGTSGPALCVPLSPLISTLAALEGPLFDVLPATAGQFYAFRHDGVAREDPTAEPACAARKGVDDLIEEVRAAAARPLSADERLALLDQECELFSRYLIGVAPGDAVRAHYRRAHAGVGVAADPAHAHAHAHAAAAAAHFAAAADSDRLVSFARRGVWATRLADTYATLFDRAGPLRRKLVLLLAMFESMADTNHRVDGPIASSWPAFLAGAVVRGIVFVGLLPVAIVLFAPGASRGAPDGQAPSVPPAKDERP